jgi:hypothetical protein
MGYIGNILPIPNNSRPDKTTVRSFSTIAAVHPTVNDVNVSPCKCNNGYALHYCRATKYFALLSTVQKY